jgi:hypothetical protein
MGYDPGCHEGQIARDAMKDIEFEDWRLHIFWGAVAVTAGIAGFVFAWGWRDLSAASASDGLLDAPSWVQAIGSIGALVTAFLVVDAQRRNAKREKADQSADQLYAVSHIIQSCQSRLNQIYGQFQATDYLRPILQARRYEAKLRAPYRALAAVPIHEAPFAFTSKHLIPALYHLEMCLELINEIGTVNLPGETERLTLLHQKFAREQWSVHASCKLALRLIEMHIQKFERAS